MNCYCDHGQETCRALGHDHAHNARRQQLVARIKRTSKYYGQTEPGAWFDVRVVSEASDYPLRGNNNNYRKSDVAFGIRLDDGTVVAI